MGKVAWLIEVRVPQNGARKRGAERADAAKCSAGILVRSPVGPTDEKPQINGGLSNRNKGSSGTSECSLEIFTKSVMNEQVSEISIIG